MNPGLRYMSLILPGTSRLPRFYLLMVTAEAQESKSKHAGPFLAPADFIPVNNLLAETCQGTSPKARSAM